jgi:Kef-type K+ transport system membrane component KefB
MIELGFVLLCLLLPPLASRLLGLGGWMPLVFVQLLLGIAATGSGLTDALREQGSDLLAGPLADTLRGLGWLGVGVLVALGATAGNGDRGNDDAAGAGDAADWRFVPISISGFLACGIVGSGLGWALAGADPSLIGPHTSRAGFAAAIGLLLSVTALPVLIAILAHTGLAHTPLGRLATRCASLDDLWLWLLMGVVLAVSVQTPTVGATAAADTAGLLVGAIAFLASMVLAVRPALRRWSARQTGVLARALVCAAVIVIAATAAHAIGLHAVLGAFVGGAVLPPALLAGWRAPLLAFNQRLLLPYHFVLSGLAISLDAGDAGFWALTAVLTGVAMLAKFGSVSAVARACGLPWRQAFALGSLMQCKGLMELVAVGVLQQAGVIDARIASALAAMAVISTVSTAPAVRAFLAWPVRFSARPA